jgi:glycosyltransferase involved in cell wall biosynthesis
MKKVLWIGPIVDNSDMKLHPAISPAANKWQLSFIKALQEQMETDIFSYLPEPVFPKGKILPKYSNIISGFNVLQIKYLNFPFIRKISIVISILLKIDFKKQYTYVFTYNNYFEHKLVAKYLQYFTKTRWVNIVADETYCIGPELTVFLSYGYFKLAEIKNKFHLDGGVDLCNKKLSLYNSNNYSEKKIILFAGAINRWTGIEKFANYFSLLDDKKYENYELHIYGKGNSEVLNSLAEANPRIKIFGFVDDEILQNAMISCHIFCNPRPLSLKNSEFNFPSKILSYLEYRKPILSTRHISFSPNYYDIVFFYDESLSDLSKQLERISNMQEDDLLSLKNKISEFILDNTWSKKVNFLINTMNSL